MTSHKIVCMLWFDFWNFVYWNISL